MNLTLTALQLTSLVSLSPQFSQNYERFTCKGCKFLQSFSKLATFRQFNSVKFVDTKFTRFLKGAVSVASQDFIKGNYSEPANFSEESVSFYRCVFLECSNSESGGAIYATSREEESHVIIRNCGFYGCTSEKQGGAICVFRTESLTIEHTCFTNCSAGSGQGNSVYSFTGEDLSLTSVSFVSAPEAAQSGSNQYYIRNVKSWMQYVNTSHSEDSSLVVITSYFCEMKYMHYSHAYSDYLMNSKRVSSLIKYVDVANCTFGSSVFFLNESKLSLVHGIFVNIEGKFLTMQSEIASTCRVVDVVFQSCSVDFDDSLITARRVVFDAGNATFYSPIAMNTDYCWVGQATWDINSVSFKLSGASVSFLLMCVVLAILYYFMKEKLEDPGGLNKKQESLRRKSSGWIGKDNNTLHVEIQEPKGDTESPPAVPLSETEGKQESGTKTYQ